MLVKCVPNSQGDNAVHVRVAYRKGQGIIASAYPAEVRPNGIMMLKLSVIGSSPEITLAAIQRNNAKLVFVCESQIKADLKNRSGPGWELVLELCAAHGLTPLEAEREAS